MPTAFPRGVADSVGRRAFVRAPGDGLVALELSSGREVWRTTEPLRPLIAWDDRLVAVRSVPGGLRVVVLDASSGRERCASPTVSLPEWANASLEGSPDFVVSAEAEGAAVVLRWSARARYRGGAAPTREVEAASRRDARGAFRVDVSTCALEEVSAAEPAVETLAGSRGGQPSPDPEVLEQHEIEGRRFQLVSRRSARGTVRFVLRAVDAATERTAWEVAIGEAAPPRPRRARP
jgi:hypothetical protein